MRYFSTLRYLVVLLVLLCTACGTAVPSIKPYKLDVQQGNVVTSKMLLQLRPGMTKSQVRFIMGTPLIQDSFHGNRWDYVYQMREAGKVTEQRRVILDFDKDLLKSVRGDVIPSGSNAADKMEEKANTGTRVVEPYKKPEEKSLIGKLKFWEKDDAAPVVKATQGDVVKKDAEKSISAEVAKKEVVPEVDASQSMLAVPLEVPVVPAVEAPSAPVVAADTAPAVAPVEVVKAPVVEVAPTATDLSAASSMPAQVEAPLSPALPLLPEQPVNSSSYQSPSGMVFDRQLRSLPEEPDVVVEIPSTRVGNKVTPTPKELPPENEPSFFDRMLEKIGF